MPPHTNEASSASQQYLASLLRKIVYHFSLEEIATLCFDLGIDFESLVGQGKQGKVRALIEYCRRYQRFKDLITKLEKERPIVKWRGEADDSGGNILDIEDTRLLNSLREAAKASDWEKVIERGQKVLTLTPDNEEAITTTAMAYFEQGAYHLLETGEINHAKSKLDQAIALNPTKNKGLFYFARGTAFFLEGNSDEALKDYNYAIANADDDDELALYYMVRSAIYLQKGDKQEALSDIDKAMKYASKEWKWQLRIGRSAMRWTPSLFYKFLLQTAMPKLVLPMIKLGYSKSL